MNGSLSGGTCALFCFSCALKKRIKAPGADFLTHSSKFFKGRFGGSVSRKSHPSRSLKTLSTPLWEAFHQNSHLALKRNDPLPHPPPPLVVLLLLSWCKVNVLLLSRSQNTSFLLQSLSTPTPLSLGHRYMIDSRVFFPS